MRIKVSSEPKPPCILSLHHCSLLDQVEAPKRRRFSVSATTPPPPPGPAPGSLGVTYHMMTSWTKCSSFLSPLQVAHVLFPLPEQVLHLWSQITVFLCLQKPLLLTLSNRRHIPAHCHPLPPLTAGLGYPLRGLYSPCSGHLVP